MAGVVFHADRGTQYTSAAFAEVCAGHKVRRSMGRIGSSYDNAAAESCFTTLKRELGDAWATAGQARLAVFGWIAFYNPAGGTPRWATVARSSSRPSTPPRPSSRCLLRDAAGNPVSIIWSVDNLTPDADPEEGTRVGASVQVQPGVQA